jgi:hypothetical protein
MIFQPSLFHTFTRGTRLLVVFALIAFSAVTTVAQQTTPPPDPNKPDEQLTKDEADIRIKQFKDIVAGLENQLRLLEAKADSLSRRLTQVQRMATDGDSTLYATLGVSKAEVEAFRQRAGVLEAKVRELKQLPDDALAEKQDQVKALENELNAMRKEKIALLPEFYDRIIALARDIKGLYREKKIRSYTVGTWAENRECLWNISARNEIYNDAFLWPKIWVANKSIIRNPDIIYPGQSFQIPQKAEKTSEEMKAERRYWRMRRAESDKTGAQSPTQPLKTGSNN